MTKSKKRTKKQASNASGAQGSGVTTTLPLATALSVRTSDGGSMMPAAYGLRASNRPPVWKQSSADGPMTISHSEYIRDVAGSGATNLAVTLPINPGQPSCFPWLSSPASQFETYRFRALRFRFETSKGTTASGSVAMAVDFDVSDPAPSTKASLMAYKDATRGPVWSSSTLVCSPRDMSQLNSRFVRVGAVVGDQKTYDVGNFFLMTSGQADTTIIGELWVDYVVDLFTPCARDLGTLISGRGVFSTGCTPALPFGSSTGTLTGDTNFTISPEGGSSIGRFQRAGQYLLELLFTGTEITSTNPTVTSNSATYGTVAVADSFTAPVSGTSGIGMYLLNVIEPALLTITFGLVGVATTLTGARYRISPYRTANG